MPTYSVLVPIAGHVEVIVEADSKEEAHEAALTSDDLELKNVVDWESLHRFTRGNVCYCPSPWEIEATLIEDDSEGA